MTTYPKYFFSILFSLLTSYSFLANAQNITIKGNIKDSETKLPISYTSIGVRNKTFGTVADSLGNFSFIIPQSSINDLDTIVFLRVGYTSIKKTWKDLSKTDWKILMVQSPKMLQEVAIQGEKGKFVTYGRTSAKMYLTPRAYKNIPKSDVKGREQATILDIDDNIFLKELSLFLSMSNFSKVTYRVNFYTVNKGLPSKLINTKDIIYETTETRGWKNIKLEPYNIYLKGYDKIAIGLQLIDSDLAPNDTAKTSFLIAAYPSPTKKSYFREKSESEWVTVKSSYLYINIKASKFKGNTNRANEEQADELANGEPVSTDHLKLMFGNNLGLGHWINVDSGKIYYESYGKGEPLILLHGNNESMASFREQLITLKEKFRVIAIDTRGQGNSTDQSKSPYLYELFANDVNSVLDKIGVKNANIVGWSDGANIGLILAAKYPDKVKKLAIFGANLFPGEEAIKKEVIDIFNTRKLNLAKNPSPKTFNEIRLTNLVLEQPDLKLDDLAKIKIPVLVMAGENDVVLDSHTRLIAKSISQSKLFIFEGGDHYVPSKQPAQFNKLIIDFMLEH